jgi:hypothetical protein
MKTNITTKDWEVLNLMRRTDKYSENSIELTHALKLLNNKTTEWQESPHTSPY